VRGLFKGNGEGDRIRTAVISIRPGRHLETGRLDLLPAQIEEVQGRVLSTIFSTSWIPNREPAASSLFQQEFALRRIVNPCQSDRLDAAVHQQIHRLQQPQVRVTELPITLSQLSLRLPRVRKLSQLDPRELIHYFTYCSLPLIVRYRDVGLERMAASSIDLHQKVLHA
jgi:hypothetical protein